MGLTITKNYFTVDGKTTKRYFDKDGTPRCTKHNEYKAKRFPGTGCPHCIARWDSVHGTQELLKLVLGEPELKPKKKTSKKKKVKLKNKIAICLDRSGSMQRFGSTVKEKLLEVVQTMEKAARDSDQETTLTLIDFDTHIDEKFFDVPICAALKIVENYRFRTGGMTAMLDATGRAVERFSDLKDASDINTSFLVITITDGLENASHRFSNYTLNSLINKVQSTDRWSFAFQVPRGYKKDVCYRLGLHEGNVIEWDTTVEGMKNAATTTSRSTQNYFRSRSAGQTSTKTFYTDMSKVTQKDVKALTDVKSKVRVLTVDKECDIRDFCKKKVNSYVKGNAYYQLTKTESKVQPYKKIVIMEKGKKAVYAGDDARNLLGLPLGETVRVKPGNHANWDVFIQSTSVNRKLVRGTKVVYVKGSQSL